MIHGRESLLQFAAVVASVGEEIVEMPRLDVEPISNGLQIAGRLLDEGVEWCILDG